MRVVSRLHRFAPVVAALALSCGAREDTPSTGAPLASAAGEMPDVVALPATTYGALAEDQKTAIALVTRDDDLLAFATDGEHGAWFRGQVLGLPATLASDGGASLTIDRDGDALTGAIAFADGAPPLAFRARAGEGLLRRLDDVRAGVELTGGWITLGGGATRGFVADGAGHHAAPPLGEGGTVDCATCSFVALGPALSTRVVDPDSLRSGLPNVERRFSFVTLGDSYASGEGAPLVDGNHDDGGDPVNGKIEVWGEGRAFGIPASAYTAEEQARLHAVARSCHRSDAAASMIAAQSLAASYPNVSIVHVLLACSGAEVPQLTSAPDPGYANCHARSGPDRDVCLSISDEGSLPPGDIPPPQLEQYDAWVARFGIVPDAMTISIGGNDVGFGAIVTDCVSPLNTSGCDASNSPARRVLGQGLRDLPGRYAVLGDAIRARQLPASRVSVTLYPNLLRKDDTGTPCSGHDFDAVGDGLLANIDADEARFALTVLSSLNDAVTELGTQQGFGVIGSHVEKTAGHSICAPVEPWFQTRPAALHSQGHDLPTPLDYVEALNPYKLSSGMVHPNRGGHRELYAPAIRAQLEPLLIQRFKPKAPARLRAVEQRAAGPITLAWDDASDVETSFHVVATRVEGDGDPASVDVRVPADSATFVIDAHGAAAYHVEVQACGDAGAGNEWCSAPVALDVANRAPRNAAAPPVAARGELTFPAATDPAHAFWRVDVEEAGAIVQRLASALPTQRIAHGTRARIASCNRVGCGPASEWVTLP